MATLDETTSQLPTDSSTPTSPPTPTDSNEISLTIHHAGTPHTFTFPSTATLSDLSTHISTTLSIPPENQKYLISPKPGLLKPPFHGPSSPHATLPLSTLLIEARKITVLGSTAAQLANLNASIAASQNSTRSYAERAASGPVKAATPARSTDWKSLQDATTYTFSTLRPLPHLPRPERSLRFLERLRDDAGIRASMVKHKWSVPLLTEMDPAAHTTHEGRTLGLNRNRGEVIELRLRTDAYDGYRDYKTIRKTLCHELAHNVWGEHDARFWKLCREIEGEVERGDWRSGGRAVGEEEFYGGPGPEGEEGAVHDHGGWTGGEYVLGGASAGGAGAATSSSTTAEPLTRREILARAAEERAKKQREQQSPR